LQVEQEFRTGTESFGKQPGAFLSNSTLAMHDFIGIHTPDLPACSEQAKGIQLIKPILLETIKNEPA
jgi:hypothetical protein